MLHLFRKWLALLLYPVDIIELTRAQLKLIGTDDAKFWEELPDDEQKHLAANAHSLSKNPAFYPTLKALARLQEQFISREAPAWESVLIGRGTVNGIDLVRIEFEKLASIHEDSLRKEQFNKYDVV